MNSTSNPKSPVAKIIVPLSESGDELVITDQKFIQQLVALGFRDGRNNKSEDLARIIKNVPPEHRQDFMAGFNAK